MVPSPAGRHVVVDGSNIATEGRSVPSLTQLDEAVRAFLEEFPHEAWTVVVDATFEHRIEPSEAQLYDEALAAGELLTPPAGTIGRGDRFILQIANRVGATVFSNDSFQEFHADYPWLFEEGRLIGGKPVPGVGWIFAARSPVRGVKSRMVTRAAKRTSKAAPGKAAPVQPPVPTTPAPARRGRKKATGPSAPLGPPPVPTAPPPGRRAAKAAPTPEVPARRDRRRRSPAAEPVNEGLAFVEFISEHPIGSAVEAEVTAFTSHGAHVLVGDVRCYVPLRGLGEPAPRAAREVLSRGETRTFVVQALDAPRRGIDLALPGFEQLEATPPLPSAADVAEEAAAPARPASRRRTRTRPVPADEAVGEGDAAAVAPLAADQASADVEAPLPESEATLAATTTKRTTKKRSTKATAPAKKRTSSAAAGRKAAAKRSTSARKAPAKRTTAKKATSTAKRTTAKKATSTAKKKSTSTARKAPAKRTTAKKATPTARKAATTATRAASTAKKAAATAKKAAAKATRATKKRS